MSSQISHRDLRNRSGEVLRAVANGETYVVTNNGKPTAQIGPVSQGAPGLPLSKPAEIRGGFSSLRRHVVEEPTSTTIDELRGER